MISEAMPAATATWDLFRKVRKHWLPPPNLTPSQFADRELVVTTGPLQGSHWRTSFAPYQKGILDAFHQGDGIQIVVVRGSSQFGKTSIIVVIVCYHIAHAPCPILVVEPTVKPMAEDFAKNRLDPIIRASPILNETVSKKRSKDSSNTVLSKTFKGGSLSIGGSNSAASLAARSILCLALDEVDRFPPELQGEGSTIDIAIKRTQAYKNRKRVLMMSSPTLRGAPIDAWFNRGDQRYFFVPCPKCDFMHPFKWANVKWKDGDATTARIHCPSCDYGMDEAERVLVLSHGEWRATNPGRADPTIASFHIWEAYSPFSSLTEIVRGFLKAREAQKAGDNSQMHTWQNTTLGEPVELDAGEGIEPDTLIVRREVYGEGIDAPMGVSCITMGVDVQDDRLEALVIGWGPGEESWLVDRQVLYGDTSQPEPWSQLDGLLEHQYRHASKQRIPIQGTCIDSAGHRTTLVYDYAAKQATRRVFAIIGRDGQRPIVSSPSPRKWGQNKRKVPLYTVGVDAAKSVLVSRFKLTEKGRGYFHVPMTDWADEELAAQLTSERLITRWSKGVPKQVWTQMRPRNEMLDAAIYALAALRLIHPDLELLMQRLKEPQPPTKPKPKRESSWLGPRKRNWLK